MDNQNILFCQACGASSDKTPWHKGSKHCKFCWDKAFTQPLGGKPKTCPTCGSTSDKVKWWGASKFCEKCIQNKMRAKKREARHWLGVMHEKKLKSIKLMGCVCPGCLVDFSGCCDEALFLVFEKCHIHSSDCREGTKREALASKEQWFWACHHCNIVQHTVCGYWELGEFFKTDCKRNVDIYTKSQQKYFGKDEVSQP